MNLSMRLSVRCEFKCGLCGQRYELDEADERRVTAALVGLSKDWCPACIQPMTPKQYEKACYKLGKIR